VYVVLRAIEAHERRDQDRDATEHPWDEDTAEKPVVVVPPAQPEQTQPEAAAAAAREANYWSVD
jgi:hypothetical protein